MLVLTVGEGKRVRVQVPLGNGQYTTCWITPMGFRSRSCRLGFEAPREVAILREALIDQPPPVPESVSSDR